MILSNRITANKREENPMRQHKARTTTVIKDVKALGLRKFSSPEAAMICLLHEQTIQILVQTTCIFIPSLFCNKKKFKGVTKRQCNKSKRTYQTLLKLIWNFFTISALTMRKSAKKQPSQA